MPETMNTPQQDLVEQQECDESMRKAIDDMANESSQDPEYFDRMRELKAHVDTDTTEVADILAEIDAIVSDTDERH